MLYTLTPGICGYVAASWYKTMGTTGSMQTILTIGALFLAPQLLLFGYLKSASTSYNPSQAIPDGTVCIMFVLWSLAAFPFCVGGGVSGRYSNLDFRPAHGMTNGWARGSAVLQFLLNLPQVAIVGVLPFSAFHIEYYDFFASIWSYKVRTKL